MYHSKYLEIVILFVWYKSPDLMDCKMQLYFISTHDKDTQQK